MTDLVTLARRYVELADELEGVRTEIKKVVMNGAGDHAPRPLSARPARAPAQAKHPNSVGAEAAEAKIVEVLTATPGMTTGAIATAVGSPTTSTVHRLRRLRSKGMVQGGGNAGWALVASA